MKENKFNQLETKLIKCFDRPSIRIRIPRLAVNHSKYPLITDWPNHYERLTIAQIIEAGYNWGMRCGKRVGNYYLAVIDLDDYWARERIKENRYVKTSKGIHHYFLIKELIPNSILENTHHQKIGELHSLGRQVVGIGSIHETGIRYTLKGRNNVKWFTKLENSIQTGKIFSWKRNSSSFEKWKKRPNSFLIY